MNKAELVEALSAHFDGNKAEAGRMLDAVVGTIMEETARHGKVSITSFGVFEKRHKPRRVVRNPRTGERKEVDAEDVPHFRPGTRMKALVAGTEPLPPRPGEKAPKKAPAKKASAKKAPAKKTPAKKAPAGKATAKKPTAGKSSGKKSTKKS